ncbi:Zinc finger, SWIM-type [Dillenia turbinata]|uniref:Protein FAR1-RELATED SEQUENCE n=1 Tax=Dillenia turbinata TaxID=194707 RepID=A0AAN8VV94_9MAGN
MTGNSLGRGICGRDEPRPPRGSKPCAGMEFESEDSAKTFYDSYARRMGFSTHVGKYSRPKPDVPIVSWDFACSREVFKRKNVESCNAMLRIERKDQDIWVVTEFVEDHNHSMTTPSRVHHLRRRTHFAGATKNPNESLDVSGDIYVSIGGNHASFESAQGVMSASPVEAICPSRNVEPAKSPGFFYAVQLDDNNRLSNVFWADARSRAAYGYFGDAVIFDTMYRPNQFQVPFAPFTVVNHHGQTVLFGCSLILDESESSFSWIFRTWLSAMNDCRPVSLTTSQDRAIQVAVAQVFPGTCHCICKWHILREGQERLAHTTIPLFFKHYERVLEQSLEKEIEADFDTLCTTPILKTPSPMEQQAANLYTRKVFAKFQEELLETFVYTANKTEGDGMISRYRVAKYEHDDKDYIVNLNFPKMKASCSCQMFENSGILCRHILTVFTVINVLTLPSHYILKRWTRNAKNGFGPDEQDSDLQDVESQILRFNNLCWESAKFAEEGAIAVETYNAAISVLREGMKKIAAVKNVAKVTPCLLGSGNSQEDGNKKNPSFGSEMIPSLWP